MLQLFTKDYIILYETEKAKTNNNIVGYHLVSRRVISTSSGVQLVCRCPKKPFWIMNPNQLGFRPSKSCINQVPEITHEIFEAFDSNPALEVRSVFLDISKAFDKVRHEGLL